MLQRIVLDGQIFAERHAGMFRYTNVILRELDRIVDKGWVDLIVPDYVDLERFENIRVVKYGRVKGIFWTQTSLLFYCLKNRKIPFGFTNTTPVLKPGTAVVHDIAYKTMKGSYRNLYGKMSCMWHRLNYWVIAKKGYPVVTVSNTSKAEIAKVYHVKEDSLSVIPNGWQHYRRIEASAGGGQRFPRIKKGEYYFTLGSTDERKNLRWILETARRNPESLFVIAGESVKNSRNKIEKVEQENVIFLGFVEDEDAKWLMENARAFLFPSIYEGFGIPLLEAMSVGTKILSSNASVMPEVCENTVSYFDPYDYNVDLDAGIRNCDISGYQRILSKYSWEKSAESLAAFLEKLDKEITGC